jgi:hypothetical protein
VERTLAAEFPNDNDALHDGTIWMCVEPCGPAEAHAPSPRREPAMEPMFEFEEDASEEPIEIVETLAPIDADAAATEVVPAPAFSEVVLATRAAEMIAEAMEIPPPPAVPTFADADALAQADAPPDAYATLLLAMMDAALACGAPLARETIAGALETDATASAWRRILRGESEDFSACALPLDEWSATVLASLLGAPAKSAQLRRELRARGVAAFGLLEAA